MIRYRYTLHVAGVWAKVDEVFPNLLTVDCWINVPTDRMGIIQIHTHEVLQLHEGLKDCIRLEVWFHIQYSR